VVKLNPGTYNLSGGINFSNKSNVTLRGSGANQTFLVFSNTTSCSGVLSNVCFVNGDTNFPGAEAHTASWTGGYAKGSTQITLSNTTGIAVGNFIILDQLNDSNTDTGGIWVCETDNVCSDEGPGGTGRSGRAQEQWVKVTGVSGNTVTISPGLYMPNWRASQSPAAWWPSTNIKMSGIEDLSLDHATSDEQAGIVFFNAYNCWVKGIRSLNSNRSHVWFFEGAGSTVRDSYFYGTKNAASQSYGIESYLSSDNLIENNIFQSIVAPLMLSGSASGSVFAYNYSFDNYYTVSPTSLMGQVWLHGGGIDNSLFEGNDGQAFFSDGIHGTHHFVTAFRNVWPGWETGKTAQVKPAILRAFSRYFNMVGNVLGRSGVQTQYEGSSAIYELGGSPGTGVPSDPLVSSTLLRWGNYDVVTGTSRFVTSEVPLAISQFANPVPSSQTLPASLYLPGRPAWFGSVPWPAIGPDVTGGQDPTGRAYKIPAHVCFDATPKTNGILNFNSTTCYGAGGTPPPTAPTSLRIIR
jgi:hypothetical protein